MKSPITGKEMTRHHEPAKLKFRKEEFEVQFHFNLCEDSGQRFTDEFLDEVNFNQIHNQYREKYGIPFPDEIIEIRNQYDISASRMSEILGFGANSYRLYESGEIPSVSNGRLILAVKDPRDFQKQVEASRHLLSGEEFEKLHSRIKDLIESKENAFSRFDLGNISAFSFIFNGLDEFSGYKRIDLDKIANIISFFSANKLLTKTLLNKLLFYLDFKFFSLEGYSMTGLTYRAIKFGPVPAEYDRLYVKLSTQDKIKINEQFMGGDIYAEIFEGTIPFQPELFSEKEFDILKLVIEKFKSAKTKDIVEMSHEEKGWVENFPIRDKISYLKYAFTMKHI